MWSASPCSQGAKRRCERDEIVEVLIRTSFFRWSEKITNKAANFEAFVVGDTYESE